MRYFFRGSTLFLRGEFTAASTGVGGGLGRVRTIVNSTVPADWDHADPERYLWLRVVEEGFPRDFYGLLTAVEMKDACVMQHDFITCFVTAGVTHPDPSDEGTINVIMHSSEGLSDAALLESIITVTEAKALALRDLGHGFAGTTTDGVIAACEGPVKHTYAGSLTEAGKRIHSAVRFGVQEALKRQQGTIATEKPTLFVFSRYGGAHWALWSPDSCPYYPCHFSGQSCDFCYCPFYPCRDPELGSFVNSSAGGKVWSCSSCPLVHYPRIAEYLKRNPEATLRELKALWERSGPD
ncbi:MAG: adenosylcobinamide amidohydrolase [Methanomicrobiales archaeon]|nr:adenosylcobinamide amidohydrolase [Methanomicrobiales archaeon]